MKHTFIRRGPLAALVLLSACSSNDVTTAVPGRSASVSSALGEPSADAGTSATPVAVSFDSLPACTSDNEGKIVSVNAPSDRVGFYYCANSVWQLIGGQLSCPDAGHATLGQVIDQGSCKLIEVGVDDNGNGQLDADEVDTSSTFCPPTGTDAGAPPAASDAGVPVVPSDSGAPPPPPPSDAGTPVTTADAGTPVVPVVDAGPSGPVCGNGIVEPGEACDLGSANGGADCNADCTVPPLGACLTCAAANCAPQYDGAVGSGSSPANLVDVSLVLSCVVGDGWAHGGGIPQSSCFFADPQQPQGSLLPCYCGSTPTSTCLATGPADHTQACASQIETASHCSPVTASCVTTSGSNPEVPLGDVLQLLNCERGACQAECGFPAPEPE